MEKISRRDILAEQQAALDEQSGMIDGMKKANLI